jgi:hypothetical protein
MRKSLLVPVAAVIAVSVFAPAGAGAASTPPCSSGDARSTFETSGQSVGVLPPCTFRLFWDNQTLTFPTGNVVVGGITWVVPYADGSERTSAVADLKAVSVRVWVADATSPNAPLVEQAVERTAIKEGHSEADGKYVWVQSGIIRNFPPGEYLVVTKASNETTSWTVRLVVTASS